MEQLEATLCQQRNAWSSDWPGGVNITTLSVPDTAYTAIEVARKLGHAVVVVADPQQRIRFMAIKNQ